MYNDDGSAKMEIGGSASATIRPTLRARHGHLQKDLKRLVRRLDVLEPAEDDKPDVKQAKQKINSALSGDLFNEGLFRGARTEVNGETVISYNCRRVSRLSRARAFGLLMAYTGCLSRPAYDRDFG
jgi:hypothetical protein